MGYNITKSFLDSAREKIKNNPPYAENDPIFDAYDGKIDIERARATDLVKMLNELGYDPYDENDYGGLQG